MRDWLEAARYPVAWWRRRRRTSSRATAAAAPKTMQAVLGEIADVAGPVLVSAQSGLGIREIWKHLDQVLGTG